MRMPSGTTDQVIYFVALDSSGNRLTGLASFTAYRDRNGAGAAAMTTPTVTEVDSSNMPGVYKLLLDEDMIIGSGNDSEEMIFHISHAGMASVSRTIEIYRPKITLGDTLATVSGSVATDILQTVMTESYASDGSTMTVAQALYMLWSMAAEKSISGTTLTTKQLDGSTTSMTFTLDSATAPSSITRA